MPTISGFYGIVIRMYVNDHLPPHFHAVYNEFEARFSIPMAEMMDKPFPHNAARLVQEWAALHVAELTHNWELAQNELLPEKIEGLDANQSD